MQRAEIVLSILGNKALSDNSFVFERLYRNLFNKELYYYTQTKAIKSRSREDGQKTAIGLTARANFAEQTNLGDYASLVDTTIELLEKEQFFFGKDQEKDFFVESVLIELLDAIYKPITLDMLDEDMPHKNTHDALIKLKNSFKDVSWTGFGQLANFKICEKEDLIISILTKRVKDGRFEEIVRRFLNYVRLSKLGNSAFLKSSSTKLIKALENIYLSEIDKCIMILMKDKCNLRFVRCFGEFIFGISGNKSAIVEVKKCLEDCLVRDLGIDPEKSNIRISNLNTNRAVFLRHEIHKNEKGIIDLLIPEDVITKTLKPFVKSAKAVHCSKRINLQIVDIIKEYNKDLQKLHEYYKEASNFTSRMRKFQHYHYLSLAKTISLKEKSSVKRTFQKYGIDISPNGKNIVKRVIGVRSTKFSKESLVYYNRFITMK